MLYIYINLALAFILLAGIVVYFRISFRSVKKNIKYRAYLIYFIYGFIAVENTILLLIFPLTNQDSKTVITLLCCFYSLIVLGILANMVFSLLVNILNKTSNLEQEYEKEHN